MPAVESMDTEAARNRQALLDSLNRIEDEYAQRNNAEAVFAVMQAKQDPGLPVAREGWQ